LTSRSTSPERFNFSALGEAPPAAQPARNSARQFRPFMKQGLREAFEAISPSPTSPDELSLELEFDPDDLDLKSPPKFTVEECRQRATTYSQPIFVRARFLNSETARSKSRPSSWVDFPIMTEQGTFIINGTERVVVSQLVRSPGVLFQPGKDEKVALRRHHPPEFAVSGCKSISRRRRTSPPTRARVSRESAGSRFLPCCALSTPRWMRSSSRSSSRTSTS